MNQRHIITTIAALALSGCVNSYPAVDSLQFRPHAQATPDTAISRVSPAQGLYELVYSSKEDAVFVASSGGWGEDAQAAILRLDPHTMAVESKIPLERKAFGLALDDANGRLYVGNTVDLSVTAVDITAGRVVGAVQLEGKVRGEDGEERYPRDLRQLAVDPGADRLFLQGHSENSVLYVVDTRSLEVEKIVPGLGGPKAPGLALDQNGHRLFVTNLRGELLTIDTRTLKIIQRVQTDMEQPLNIAFDARTGRLFITDQGLASIREWQESAIPGFVSRNPGNRVVVLDADTGRMLRNIPTAAGPMGILLDPEERRIYVSNRAAGKVSIYDADSYALLRTVPLPTHPNSLALDPRTDALFVSIKNGEDAEETAPESVARVALNPD